MTSDANGRVLSLLFFFLLGLSISVKGFEELAEQREESANLHKPLKTGLEKVKDIQPGRRFFRYLLLLSFGRTFLFSYLWASRRRKKITNERTLDNSPSIERFFTHPPKRNVDEQPFDGLLVGCLFLGLSSFVFLIHSPTKRQLTTSDPKTQIMKIKDWVFGPNGRYLTFSRLLFVYLLRF